MMQRYHILYTYLYKLYYTRQVTYISINCSGYIIGTIILLYYDKNYFIRNETTVAAWFPPHFRPASTCANTPQRFFSFFPSFTLLLSGTNIILYFYYLLSLPPKKTFHTPPAAYLSLFAMRAHALHAIEWYVILYTYACTHDTMHPSLRVSLHPLRTLLRWWFGMHAFQELVEAVAVAALVEAHRERLPGSLASAIEIRRRAAAASQLCPHASTSPQHYYIIIPITVIL